MNTTDNTIGTAGSTSGRDEAPPGLRQPRSLSLSHQLGANRLEKALVVLEPTRLVGTVVWPIGEAKPG